MNTARAVYQLVDFGSFSPRRRSDTSASEIDNGISPPEDANTTSNVSGAQSHQIAYLNGLRGLAALLVYMHHQAPFFYGVEPDFERGFAYVDDHGNTTRHLASYPIIRLFFSGGHAMLAVFFVLSGYVLSRTAVVQMHRGQYGQCYLSIVSTTVRRPLRLYMPVIGLTLVQTILMHLPFGLAFNSSIPEPQEYLGLELAFAAGELVELLNPFRGHGFDKVPFSYNPILWTIPVELTGSVLVLATLGLLNATHETRLRWLQLPLLALFAIALLLTYQWAMALFIAGVTLCVIDVSSMQDVGLLDHQLAQIMNGQIPEPAKKQSIASSIRIAIQYTLLLSLGMYLLGQPSGVKNPRRSLNTMGWRFLTEHTPSLYYNDEYWRFYQSIGACVVMFSVLRLPWLQWLLASRPLLYLGRISFSLYIVQTPALCFVVDRVQRLFGVEPRSYYGHMWIDGRLSFIPEIGMPGFSLRFWLVICISFPMVLFLSGYVARWLDEPSVRLGRAVSAKLGFERVTIDDHPAMDALRYEDEGPLQRMD